MIRATFAGWMRLQAAAAVLATGACTAKNPDIPVGAPAYQLVPADLVESGAGPQEYRIGPLDTISVIVFQEPDLSLPSVAVDTSGNILLPLIGSVRAVNLTPAELSNAIATRLGEYLVKPSVAVSVINSVSQRVTVDGSVEQPGVYALQGRTTLIDALAMARGTSRVAALDQVIVFRRINGRLAAARFDIKQIRLGKQPNPDILGSDIIVVGFNGIKGVYRDLVLSSALVSSFSYILAR